MTSANLRRSILELGTRLGFVRPRMARVVALDRAAFLEAWLREGRAGDMRFLLHHRKARVDPRSRYPWARTIVSAFVPYAPPAPAFDWRQELRGRIAAYALGADYHEVVETSLRRWTAEIEALQPGLRAAAFVDTGAVFEHEWAMRSGVGWTGKHTLTLSEDVGSYAFLAEVLLSAELEPDPPAVDRCGSCTSCVAACPTAAIEPGYRLDPRRCISYLTIEHRGAIDRELRPLLGGWIFGCDLCQVACPWNRHVASEPRPELAPDLAATLLLDEAAFDALYGTSAVRRTGRVGLARNAAVALGNSGNPDALAALERAVSEHDSALVRAHAAWGLGRLLPVAGRRVRDALERGLVDADESVRGECHRALDGEPAGS